MPINLMKEYYKESCYNVLHHKSMYEGRRKRFFDCVENLKQSDYCIQRMPEIALDMYVAYLKYETTRFQVHQMIWATENEEYKDLYRNIVGEDE